MNKTLVPILVIIGSNLLYHLAQKKLSGLASPFIFLCVAYVGAFALSLAMHYTTKNGGPLFPFNETTWLWIFLLGIGILGIELGFYWAYRQGWPLNRTALFSHASLSLLLIPFGMLLYGETLSLKKVIGFVLTLVGLVLIH
jgi:uncharacterized membrane protein